MTEYVILATLIALVAVVGIQVFGGTVLGLFNDALLAF
jgi:Flp pilus assembly pilin Flp